jgi:prepilin-type N-terminal cleavage/methylation domain-containing protein
MKWSVGVMEHGSDVSERPHHSITPSRHFHTRSGVTLIELLLVVAIFLIMASVSVPYFTRSFQSTQLRTACREVVSTHKYARSMAVLNQKQMALLVDTRGRELEIVSVTGPGGGSAQEKFLDSRSRRAVDQVVGSGGSAKPAADAPKPTIASDVVRPFPRDIRIQSFKTSREDQSFEGVYWITYYPNGMSDGFEVTLSDKDDKRATVRVEPISGGTKVEYE